MNIIKSYTYNGKTYDFVSNRKARIEIENLQTNFLSTNKEAREKLQQLDKLQSKVANAKDKEEKEKYQQELMSLQYDLIPYINEVNIPDEQICYIILKNYKPYREEMTPAFSQLVTPTILVRLRKGVHNRNLARERPTP